MIRVFAAYELFLIIPSVVVGWSVSNRECNLAVTLLVSGHLIAALSFTSLARYFTPSWPRPPPPPVFRVNEPLKFHLKFARILTPRLTFEFKTDIRVMKNSLWTCETNAPADFRLGGGRGGGKQIKDTHCWQEKIKRLNSCCNVRVSSSQSIYLALCAR